MRIIALTATAAEDTKATILDVLRMRDVLALRDSPNKNIMYRVEYLPNDSTIEKCFGWIAMEVKEGKNETIIYCQTIKQCSLLYGNLKILLGNFFRDATTKLPKLEMLHSCTPQDNKDTILESFGKEDGHVQILIATIAFGMGVNCKGVHRTIHFGPSKNIESFVQESGRAGRDGNPSLSLVLYKGLMLNHVERDIKDFVKTKNCRREMLLRHFTVADSSIDGPSHTCCDNCAAKCECGDTVKNTCSVELVINSNNNNLQKPSDKFPTHK